MGGPASAASPERKLNQIQRRLLMGLGRRPEPELQRTPVPPQRWHFTTLSPFFSRPLPSQFLHFCFFLTLGPFSLAIMTSRRCCRGSRSNASRGERSGRRDTVAVHSMHKPDGAPSFARLRAKTARGNTCTPRFTVADPI